jgi:hypothetical protein
MRSVRVLPHVTKLDDARHLPVRGVSAYRAGSARADRRELRDARGAGEPDAVFAMREEGRGGRGDRETETARRAEESALSVQMARRREIVCVGALALDE